MRGATPSGSRPSRGLAALARAVGWNFATHRTDRPPAPALLALYAALSPAGGGEPMLRLGSLAFAAPWLLLALAALPIIWWLLRVTPPAPRRMPFPAIRLLLGLNPREETPARTPLVADPAAHRAGGAGHRRRSPIRC